MADTTVLANQPSEQPTREAMPGSTAEAAQATPDTPAATTHPDAGLLEAWEQWLTAFRDSHTERVSFDALSATLDQLEVVIAGRPAQTVAGIVVKLKTAFQSLAEPTYKDEAAFAQNGRPTVSMLNDHRSRLLWSAIENLQQLDGKAAA